jgi:hypothetical protein
MVNNTFFFIIGTLVGSGITAIAFRLGANTFKMGVEIITDPSEGNTEEDELDELITESYNYDTYTNYIDDLEQEEDKDDLPN